MSPTRSTLWPRVLLALAVGLLLPACGGGGAGARGLVFVAPEGDGWRELEGIAENRPSFVDFGRIPDGESVQHTFFLQNTDPRPLTIERMDASCTCTVPVVVARTLEGEVVEGSQERGKPVITIAPSGVVEITVRIDSRRVRTKNVDKYNFVRIATDSENGAYLQLEAHLIVERPFRATPEQLDYGRVARSGRAVLQTDIVRAGESETRLVGLEEVPPNVVATLEQEWRANVPIWVLRAEIVELGDLGAWRGEIAIQVETLEGAPFPSLRVPLRAAVVEDIELTPARLHLGNVDPRVGAEATAELACNLADLRVKILGGRVSGEGENHLHLDWSPKSTAADGRADRWELRLRVDPGIDEGVFSGDLRIDIDDPVRSPLVFPYAGIARAVPDR